MRSSGTDLMILQPYRGMALNYFHGSFRGRKLASTEASTEALVKEN